MRLRFIHKPGCTCSCPPYLFLAFQWRWPFVRWSWNGTCLCDIMRLLDRLP
jgi:hypothetical protein